MSKHYNMDDTKTEWIINYANLLFILKDIVDENG